MNESFEQHRNARTETSDLVLHPSAPGYKQVRLRPGSNFVGRNSETEIKDLYISRKHVEVVVDTTAQGTRCKVRCTNRARGDGATVDTKLVNTDFADLPIGGSLVLLSGDPNKAGRPFSFTLERYNEENGDETADPIGQSNPQGREAEEHQSVAYKKLVTFTEHFICAICHELYVNPTEVDCNGRHIFCRDCVESFAGRDAHVQCPVCQTRISKRRVDHVIKTTTDGVKRKRDGTPASSTGYQSQAIKTMEEVIKWLVDERMFDSDDESEWRRRSGLDILPRKKRPKPERALQTLAAVRRSGKRPEIISLVDDE